MPAASNIAILDAQATPVSHTYVPIGPDTKDASIFWFEDQSQASPIGYWKLSVQLKRPAAGKVGQSSVNRTFRVVIGLHQPIMENTTNSTVSGVAPAPTLSYVPRVITEFVMPERAALLDRKNLRKMMALALADAQIVSVVETLASIY